MLSLHPDSINYVITESEEEASSSTSEDSSDEDQVCKECGKDDSDAGN